MSKTQLVPVVQIESVKPSFRSRVRDFFLIKKMNKDQSGWKKNVEEQLGLTKYMIKKFVEDKNKDGITTKDIAIELDNLNE